MKLDAKKKLILTFRKWQTFSYFWSSETYIRTEFCYSYFIEETYHVQWFKNTCFWKCSSKFHEHRMENTECKSANSKSKSLFFLFFNYILKQTFSKQRNEENVPASWWENISANIFILANLKCWYVFGWDLFSWYLLFKPIMFKDWQIRPLAPAVWVFDCWMAGYSPPSGYSYFLWIEFNDGVPHLVLFGNYVWGNIVSLFKLSLIITLIPIATNTMAAHS